PTSNPFPYTTLFRSDGERAAHDGERVAGQQHGRPAGHGLARRDPHDRAAVGAGHLAGGGDQARHHMTSRAPSFTLTSASLTTTLDRKSTRLNSSHRT